MREWIPYEVFIATNIPGGNGQKQPCCLSAAFMSDLNGIAIALRILYLC